MQEVRASQDTWAVAAALPLGGTEAGGGCSGLGASQGAWAADAKPESFCGRKGGARCCRAPSCWLLELATTSAWESRWRLASRVDSWHTHAAVPGVEVGEKTPTQVQR